MRLLFNTHFIITGDHINPFDGALLIMNHRNRLDWNFMWAGMYYSAKPPAHKLKMVLKSAIRHVPFAGWVMQLSGFLYIQRRWDHDQSSMEKQLKYFSDVKDTNQVRSVCLIVLQFTYLKYKELFYHLNGHHSSLIF